MAMFQSQPKWHCGLRSLTPRALGDRGMQHDADAVLAGDKRLRDVGAMTEEAIVRLQGEPVVDEDRDDGVDAFEIEIPMPFEIIRIDGDGALEHPLLVRHPLDVCLVPAAIGVGNDISPFERAVHVARARDRQGMAVVGRSEQPVAGKIDADGVAIVDLGRHTHSPFVGR